MDQEDLAELRDGQTLVLQNEEVDISGKYAGDLASRSLDAGDEQEYGQRIHLIILHLMSATVRYH